MTLSARVYVLYTGGTFGTVASTPGDFDSPLCAGGLDDVRVHLPDVSRLGIDYTIESLRDLDGVTVLPPFDSSNVTSHHWRCIAACIARVYRDYDGFVIIHGTDTMAYTASALSFMLANLAKPVVITGSQLPIAHSRTDAAGNFVNALALAGYRATGLPLVPEVVICFGDAILRGNRARKMSTTSWRGFDSPNCARIGRVAATVEIDEEQVRRTSVSVDDFYVRLDLNDDVVDIALFPGIRPDHLHLLLDDARVRGVLLRTFGAGNAPTDPTLLDVVAKAVRNGKILVNVTHCPQGMVDAGLYETSVDLVDSGVVSGLDITPEAAQTKLMHLLANEPVAEVGRLMQVEQCGEQSLSLFELALERTTVSTATNGRSVVRLTTQLPSKLRRASLSRVFLRVSGVRGQGLQPGLPYAVSAYLNYLAAAPGTQREDPRFAAYLPVVAGQEPPELRKEVTDTARRVIDDGRSVSVTLVADSDCELLVERATLSITTS